MVSGMHSEIRRLCQNNRFPTVQWFTYMYSWHCGNILVCEGSVHMVQFALCATAVSYMRFCEIVHTVQWVWMWFCYVYVNWGAYCIPWNHTLQLHGMGIQPNCVWCRHTPVYRTHWKSHNMNTLIDTCTIHFPHRKCKEKNRTVWTSLYTKTLFSKCLSLNLLKYFWEKSNDPVVSFIIFCDTWEPNILSYKHCTRQA